MSKHHTRNTVSFSAYCNKCGRMTQHRVDDRRKGPCLECIERLGAEQTKGPPAQQIGLFSIQPELAPPQQAGSH
jgi:hypothetical protein